MKILNLYAGIGGNRFLWDEVADINVTAVENDENIANEYSRNFPDDTVIVADAHEYLLDNYMNFDFIWSSPPCVSYSLLNYTLHAQGIRRYPAVELIQEIMYLKAYAKKQLWVIENVKPVLEFIRPTFKLNRHYYWSNFHVTTHKIVPDFNIKDAKKTKLEDYHNIYLSSNFIGDGTTAIRNCVHPPDGKLILEYAMKLKTTNRQTAVEEFL